MKLIIENSEGIKINRSNKTLAKLDALSDKNHFNPQIKYSQQTNPNE